MPWTIIALVVVFVYVGLRDERPEPAEPVIVKGVRIEGLEIGPRDGHRRSRVLMTITNTTDKISLACRWRSSQVTTAGRWVRFSCLRWAKNRSGQ